MTLFLLNINYPELPFFYIKTICLRHGMMDSHTWAAVWLQSCGSGCLKNYHRCKVATLMKDTKGSFIIYQLFSTLAEWDERHTFTWKQIHLEALMCFTRSETWGVITVFATMGRRSGPLSPTKRWLLPSPRRPRYSNGIWGGVEDSAGLLMSSMSPPYLQIQTPKHTHVHADSFLHIITHRKP